MLIIFGQQLYLEKEQFLSLVSVIHLLPGLKCRYLPRKIQIKIIKQNIPFEVNKSFSYMSVPYDRMVGAELRSTFVSVFWNLTLYIYKIYNSIFPDE